MRIYLIWRSKVTFFPDPPGDDESETDIRSFMISPSTSTSSPAQRNGDGFNGYDMTIFDGFHRKYENIATSLPSDSDSDTHCDDVASGTTDDADRTRTEYKSRSSGETSESNMRRMVRRLSSFHERIPVRIQNFLLKYTLFFFNFLSWVSFHYIMLFSFSNRPHSGNTLS